MFTGIVEERGSVIALAGSRLTVSCSTAADAGGVGASVAVNGVCLTVVEVTPTALSFDLSEETLERTTLGLMRPGAPVNLERPMTATARFGGHLVQGHVDAVGEVVSITLQPGSGAWLSVRPPAEVHRYLVEKGSVCVDGISLTVAAMDEEDFSIAVIPHTLAVTTLGSARAGDRVNLEVDVVAKYVAKYVQALMEGVRR